MKEKSSSKLTYNILQLQNLIKRDPPSYYEEFFTQYQHYKSLLELFKHNAQDYNENVADLVMFLAQVSSCYKEDLKNFPQEVMRMLRDYSTVLDPSMRMCFCKALILMRNREMLTPTDLITLCFELLRCRDKTLRKYLQIYITSDIKKMNAKHKNAKVNNTLQNFMFQMLADENAIAAKVSLDIMIELYRRNIWKDVKTVNAIATACLSRSNKILVTAHKFFLGVDEEIENEISDSEEDNTPTIKEVMNANKVNKTSRRRIKVMKRTVQALKKSKKKKVKDVFDFSALHLLHDPQGMAEKLFKRLQSMNERFEIKMMVMDLVSRLVGVHKLILLNFYSFLIRYLNPRQTDVTKILMFAAQAGHEHAPPEVMGPLIKTIANNFITERNSSEAITVGINSIREICIRCPFGIERDLLHDLMEYQKYKNKNVQMAAKSLMQLYRRINPQILVRKYRSKPTEMSKELNSIEYGASQAKSYIPGSEVLPLNPTEGTDEEIDDNDEGNESDGSWVDVSHSEDELPDPDENEDVDNEHEENEEKNNKDPNTPAQSDVDKLLNADEKDTTKDDSESLSETVGDKEKAIFVSHSRILSQEEFQKMKVAQLAKEVQFTKGKKRKAEDSTSVLDLQRAELVRLKDIEKLHKRPKPDKETRLAIAQEGREGREKFSKKKQKNPLASKTHKQNNKKKAFMMIKHKVRSKVKRSFREKQMALRDHLLKRKKYK